MRIDVTPAWGRGVLGPDEFAWLAGLVRKSCGIALGPGKRSMLEGRLRRRLRALQLVSFADYLALLSDPASREAELPALVDAVTTNETAFYREPAQFRFLAAEGLARLAASAAAAGQPAAAPARRGFKAWSAACSTGEEPYTLAMVLAEAGPKWLPHGFSILGTDIARPVLAQAERAIYPQARSEPLPPPLAKRYLLLSRDRRLDLVRVVPELRERVRFERLNLLGQTGWPSDCFDLIFCRNVLIYFGPEDRRKVLLGLCGRLRPGGILCLGHADGSAVVDLPLRPLQPNTYERLRDGRS